jgi:hypothetical protein
LRYNRKYIWIAAAGLILLLACFTWAARERRQRVELEYQAESFYQKSFFELVQHLDLVAGNLAQSVSCVSQEQTALSLASVWRHSLAAQSNLGALPLSPVQLDQTEKFLSVAGDTARWLIKKTAKANACLSDSEKDELLALLNDSKQLCAEIGGISAEVMSRDSAFTRAPGQVSDRLHSMEQKLENLDLKNLNPEGLLPAGAVPGNPGTGSFSRGNSGSDGAAPGNLIPWSARLDGFNPEDPTRYFGAPPRNNRTESGISSAQGARIALEWWFGPGTDSPASSDSMASTASFEAILAYEGAGDISTYGYELRRIGQTLPLAYVDVTRENGIVLWAVRMPDESAGADPADSGAGSAAPGGGQNDSGAAEKLARAFLEGRGYPLMEIVQEEIHRNPQAVGYGVYTLAPAQDDVLLYPDQIKIQVDLSRMVIVGFEGTPYYQHHRPRTSLEPPLRLQWTKEQIQAMANPLLKVARIRLALIQDDLGGEILTWEVQGSLEDEIFSVFYNAETGAEERIIRRTQPTTYLFSASGS